MEVGCQLKETFTFSKLPETPSADLLVEWKQVVKDFNNNPTKSTKKASAKSGEKPASKPTMGEDAGMNLYLQKPKQQ